MMTEETMWHAVATYRHLPHVEARRKELLRQDWVSWHALCQACVEELLRRVGREGRRRDA